LAVGDFNDDGKLDLVGIGSANSIATLLGNGDGTFQPAITSVAGPHPSDLAMADFNGDGRADLAVVVNPSGSPAVVSILLGNGNGTFQPPVHYPAEAGSGGLGDWRFQWRRKAGPGRREPHPVEFQRHGGSAEGER
jgi:FG-GAP-like repeat